ncbi:cholecystokinin receptor type A-like [Gigantopelta aegis]|uniref:cholecystokinin receptor type A-like n=1 Tax=Gigantopelta aegis TaxID=1735272 RepID=UPI001B889F2B|nr:cholecystokinin receptor type A-like [Gigantopelta aegis]
MAATTMEQPSPMNQSSSFMETSTDLDIYYANTSGNGGKLSRNYLPSERWPYFNLYGYQFWGVVLFIVVVGIIGNILVFIIMRDNKLNFLSYSVYLKFLACTDSFLLIIRLIQETLRVFHLQQLARINTDMCKFSYILRFPATLLSPWLVVGLSLDRYVCVRFPLTRDRLCTRKKAIIICSTMLCLAFAMIVPFVVDGELKNGQCLPSDGLKSYYTFIRLVFSCSLPSLLILILNILIVIQIQRSHKFQNTFRTSASDAVTRQQDRSIRPLVLVSVLAFVTLLPVSVSEAVHVSLMISKTDSMALTLGMKLWPVFSTIYMLNFGQNFYILIGSSSNYRRIIKNRLACCSLKWNKKNPRNQDTLSKIHPRSVVPGSRSTEVSSVCAASDNKILEKEVSSPDITSPEA